MCAVFFLGGRAGMGLGAFVLPPRRGGERSARSFFGGGSAAKAMGGAELGVGQGGRFLTWIREGAVKRRDGLGGAALFAVRALLCGVILMERPRREGWPPAQGARARIGVVRGC